MMPQVNQQIVFLIKTSLWKILYKICFYNFDSNSLSLTNKVNGFDLKMSSNYNFLSEVPDYGANIEVSNKF